MYILARAQRSQISKLLNSCVPVWDVVLMQFMRSFPFKRSDVILSPRGITLFPARLTGRPVHLSTTRVRKAMDWEKAKNQPSQLAHSSAVGNQPSFLALVSMPKDFPL